jgi:hypothetical protein
MCKVEKPSHETPQKNLFRYPSAQLLLAWVYLPFLAVLRPDD